MIKITFILIICLSVISDIASQNNNLNLDINSGISPEAEEIIGGFTDSEIDTGAIIFLRDAKMVVDADGMFNVTYHIVGRIYDEEAKNDYSQIPVMFNSYYEEMNLDFARTIADDKTFTDVSNDAVQIKTLPDYYGLNTYTDSKILAFSLPALKPGKWFEYQISYKNKLPVIGNYWFETFTFNFILRSLKDPFFLRADQVKVSRFTLIVKENEIFKSDIINADVSEEVMNDNGNKKYIWEMEDVPSFTFESYMPYLYEEIPILTVSSIPDWKTFGNWMYSESISAMSTSDQISILSS